MTKSIVQQTKDELKAKQRANRAGIPVTGVYGLMFLFVCVSIGYSTYMVALGTDDLVSKVMILPQALFAIGFVSYKAVK